MRFKFYCLAKERMKEGGFNLRKWLICNEELAGLIAEREQQSFTSPPPDKESFAKTTINSMSTDPVSSEFEQKVLGPIWDYKNDSFCFKPINIYEVSKSLPATKRLFH